MSTWCSVQIVWSNSAVNLPNIINNFGVNRSVTELELGCLRINDGFKSLGFLIQIRRDPAFIKLLKNA